MDFVTSEILIVKRNFGFINKVLRLFRKKFSNFVST